jgi:hypothetical protein
MAIDDDQSVRLTDDPERKPPAISVTLLRTHSITVVFTVRELTRPLSKLHIYV